MEAGFFTSEESGVDVGSRAKLMLGERKLGHKSVETGVGESRGAYLDEASHYRIRVAVSCRLVTSETLSYVLVSYS